MSAAIFIFLLVGLTFLLIVCVSHNSPPPKYFMAQWCTELRFTPSSFATSHPLFSPLCICCRSFILTAGAMTWPRFWIWFFYSMDLKKDPVLTTEDALWFMISAFGFKMSSSSPDDTYSRLTDSIRRRFLINSWTVSGWRLNLHQVASSPARLIFL